MDAIEQGDTDWEVLNNALSDAKSASPDSTSTYLEFLASKDVPDSKAHRNVKLAIIHATHALELETDKLTQEYYRLFGQMEECHIDLDPFVSVSNVEFWKEEFSNLKNKLEDKPEPKEAEEVVRRYYTVARVMIKLEGSVVEVETTRKHLDVCVGLLGEGEEYHY